MDSRSQLPNLDPRKSPLLVGQVTETPLDLVTSRLLFTFPLNSQQVEWLNTVIYEDDVFYINYWSLTHTFFGMIWGLLMVCIFYYFPSISSYLTVTNYLILHTLFEIWEMWAGGYFTGEFELTLQELVDGVMDTLFGLAGVFLVLRFFERQSTFWS